MVDLKSHTDCERDHEGPWRLLNQLLMWKVCASSVCLDFNRLKILFLGFGYRLFLFLNSDPECDNL